MADRSKAALKAVAARRRNETKRHKELAQIICDLVTELGKNYADWHLVQKKADALGKLANTAKEGKLKSGA